MKKNNLVLTAMLAIALCFTACSSNDDIDVNNITLNETSLSLAVGDEFTLTATVLPDNATSQHVTWTSSDEAVATVDNSGKVIAIAEGAATITAQAGDKTATCEVTVGAVSYSIGDYYPNATNPEGVVFWVKPGSSGAHGKVVALNETHVSKWGIDNDEQAAGVANIRSFTDGATATKNMIAKYKSSGTFNNDYPAFFYIYNTVNSGNENGAWYLPARDELKMLYAGYSGKIYESITDWTTGTMPGYDSPECAAARAAFNTKLTAKSGMAIGSGENSVNWWYLSSSEINASRSYSFTFEVGNYNIDEKSYNGNIRWVREF